MRRFQLSSFLSPFSRQAPPPNKNLPRGVSRTRRLFLESLEQRNPLAGDIIIGDAGVTEGTDTEWPGGWVEIEFPITYSGDEVTGGFTVDWSIVFDGTADDADFVDQYQSGTVEFEGLDQPGGETKNAVIRVWSDDLVELNETFQVDLGAISVQGITISDGRADGTITDDDLAEIQVHIKGSGDYNEQYSMTYPEPNSGTNYTWYVNFYLTNPVDVDVSFDYGFSDQWATQGTDYTVSSSSGTVTFSAGDDGYPDAFTAITVTYVGDDIVERDEIFTLLLTNLDNHARAVSLVDDTVPFTIQNNETATVGIMVDDIVTPLEKLEKNSGDPAPTFRFMVFVDKAVETSFTVDVATQSGTATGGEDYVVKVEAIPFAGTAGEWHHFTVTGIVDLKVEMDEVFKAVVQDNIQASGRNVEPSFEPWAEATILNDDQAKVSISGGSVTEGNSGTKQLPFTLSLDRPVDHDVVVRVLVWGVSATSTEGAEQDFVLPQNGEVFVTIPGGQTSAPFNITVLGDTRDENDETIVGSIDTIDSGDFDVIEDPHQGEDDATIQDDD